MRHFGVPCLALVLTLAAPAAAQIAMPASPQAAADTTQLPPMAIPLADIPARAQEADARLEEIRQLLPRDRAVTEVSNAYTAAQDTINGLLQFQAQLSRQHATKRSLTDLHNEWIRRSSLMRDWQQTVGTRLTALSTAQAELMRRTTTWGLTVSAARQGGAATSVVDLANGVRESAATMEDSVAARVNATLRLQSQIGRTLTSIQQADEQVNEQIAAARRNLFRLDAPPLWEGLGGGTDLQTLGATAQAGAKQTWAELGYFYEVYRVSIYLHLASMLGILFAVFWFRGKLERHTTEQPAASARRVLDHPIAGSALIIALAALYLYPRAPLSIYDVALLLTVVPLLRLLPAFLPSALLRPAVVWTLLFAVQRTGGILLSGSPYQRPASLLVSLLGAGGLLWLLRPDGALRQLGGTAYDGALRVAAHLATGVFLAAAIANVVGNVSLALLLSSGMVASAYLLLVVLTAVRILGGVLIVATRSEVASASRFVAGRKDALVTAGLKLLTFLAAATWLAITFWLFDALGPLTSFLTGVLGASLHIGELHVSLGAILTFVLTLWVARWISRAFSGVLEVDVLSRLDLPRGIPNVIARLTQYTLFAVGLVFALAALGLELTQLTIIGGALGVGIGFGLQNVVNNFVSGLILAFERPIREGDIVQLETLTGEVRRIGFRASIIRTYEGAEVIVPNGSLISKDVINWTLSDQQRRLSVQVGVAYGSDPARVLELLKQIPAQYSNILKVPEPIALFIGFGDSALNFELRFWTVDADRVAIIRSDVTVAVNNALAAAGIEIPFPQRDLHLRSVDGPAAAQLRGASPTGGEPA